MPCELPRKILGLAWSDLFLEACLFALRSVLRGRGLLITARFGHVTITTGDAPSLEWVFFFLRTYLMANG